MDSFVILYNRLHKADNDHLTFQKSMSGLYSHFIIKNYCTHRFINCNNYVAKEGYGKLEISNWIYRDYRNKNNNGTNTTSRHLIHETVYIQLLWILFVCSRKMTLIHHTMVSINNTVIYLVILLLLDTPTEWNDIVFEWCYKLYQLLE